LASSSLAFFSVDLTYPFLNFRVGVGQRGFRIKGGKCIERNPFLPVLCLIAGIPFFGVRTNEVYSLHTARSVAKHKRLAVFHVRWE